MSGNVNYRIRLAFSTLALVEAENPTLLEGEVWQEKNAGTGQATGRSKTGDGVTAFTSLPFDPSGSGDVVGPASSTDGRAALFDGTTGKLLKQSAAAPVLEGDSRLTDARTPAAHNQAANTISDSTTAGRALLTAADAIAQRTALGLGTAATTASTDYATAAQGVSNGNSHDHSGGDGAQIAYSSLSGLPTLPTGTNTGDQTIANTSDATSHTVTLSASGGSLQLVEGGNITLTTTGTSAAAVVTIASTGGGAPADASEAEATAGTETANRSWSPLRIFQGAAGWWLTVSSAFGRSLVAAADLAAGKTILGIRQFEITSSETWAKPSGTRMAFVHVVGGGGGAGSGKRSPTSGGRSGGGGGASGQSVEAWFFGSDLPDDVVCTIGSGGSGAAGRTTDNTNGTTGSAGGDTTFGALLYAAGGAAGVGGGIGSQGGAARTFVNAVFEGSGGALGNSVAGTQGNLGARCPAGGAGGAGANGGSTTARNGSAGNVGFAVRRGPATATASTTISGNPTAGIAGVSGARPGSNGGNATAGSGSSGGSGAYATGQQGGNGGNGAFPGGGGGGGGASDDGFESGAGGAGGAGVIRIWCW